MAQSVIPLDAAHDVKGFNCGNEDLNNYLRQNAGQHMRKMISRTYVLVDDDEPDTIQAYFTLAIRPMVPKGELPPAYQRRLPREVPGYTLARLAVDERWQRQGIGSDLIMNAMDRIREAAENVGGYGFFVDAKDESAAEYYIHFGFVRMPSNPLILFMPVSDFPV